MKKGYIFGILFFSSLWGFSEAVLGGFLYNRQIPYASVYLTIIGFSILTIARVYLPRMGTASAIGALAMLYKFLNTPFFACHFLGIILLAVCYDLFFSVFKLKNRSVCAALATYAGYSLFALMITYVFRYSLWAEAGLAKVVSHIGIGGTLAALGCAVVVPVSQRFGEWLQAKRAAVEELTVDFARLRLVMVTAGMWLFALVVFVMHYNGGQV